MSSSGPDRVRKRSRFRWLGTGLAGLALVLVALGACSEWLGFQAARQFPARGTLSHVTDATLHYREIRPQSASKGTVVLVHGAWSGHADLLATLGPHLRDHRVIAVDRPGLGWSDRPGGWNMADPARQAETVMRLLDEIAPERLVLLAIRLAARCRPTSPSSDRNVCTGSFC